MWIRAAIALIIFLLPGGSLVLVAAAAYRGLRDRSGRVRGDHPAVQVVAK